MVKKKGTREEVYLGLAQKTSGNMRKDDIIRRETAKKPKFLSRKISERMKKNKKSFKNKNSQPNLKAMTNLSIRFNEADNVCQEYYCESLIEKPSKESIFKVETLENINFNEINLNEL